jgi:hypothetical protein
LCHRRHRLGSIPFCRISNCIPHNHVYWSYNRRGNNREWNRPDLLADAFHSSSLFRPETIGGVQSQERLAAASLVRSVNPKQKRIQPGRMRLSQRVAEVSEVDFPSWEPAMKSGAIHNSRDLLQRPAADLVYADSTLGGEGFEPRSPIETAFFETVPDTATANRLGSRNRF